MISLPGIVMVQVLWGLADALLPFWLAAALKKIKRASFQPMSVSSSLYSIRKGRNHTLKNVVVPNFAIYLLLFFF